MDNATLSACQPSAGVQLLAPLLPRFTFNGKFVYFLNWPHPAPQLSRISASQDGEHEMFFPEKKKMGMNHSRFYDTGRRRNFFVKFTATVGRVGDVWGCVVVVIAAL